ncbi:thioredoxin family protein [Flavobacterium sp. GT3R68]|uniref:thioredoxin family protein n=1 Tax=Flavobacterium sp. GT3R68 TaxID=2594437 RepID=UPI000F89AC83|nr:thioredoxin family protein [Flavobacterium sp. GT3R68]RTY92441.1 thioredoxin family protein [Flavobacterium sp. GSN2]TRW94066.1 thioredoxin family protein [Flavobacterium sp. GT3R68]
MNKILITLLLVLGSFAVEAQESVWQSDVKKAIEISKKTKKPLLLFFTGSDWCGWCIRLQKEVLKTPEFEAWSKRNVVLLELDFPRRTPQAEELKKQNSELQQIFGIQGFPTVWFVNATDKDGKVNFVQLGSTGYVAGGPMAWLDTANQILKLDSQKEKIAIEKAVKKIKKKQT